MSASNIEDVINELTVIVERAKHDSSRLGLFAALYRKVTISVKHGISSGRFDNGDRMEELDVRFANRYLEAYGLHSSGQKTTECWELAFKTARQWRPVILQHLLLGMNAHINLDLGIAAAETCTGAELPSLKHDFDEINRILADLVQPVQDGIGVVSPWIGFLEKKNSPIDDAIINFSMDKARASAWDFAVKLNSVDGSARETMIMNRDRYVAGLGRRVEKPGRILLPLGLLAIRLRESSDIPYVIDVLS